MMGLLRWLLWRCGAASRPLTGSYDQHPFSAEWDAHLSGAIAAGDVALVDGYTAKVGGIYVWIRNYPYAFGRPFCGVQVLPSLQTRETLHRACVAAMIAAAAKGGAA